MRFWIILVVLLSACIGGPQETVVETTSVSTSSVEAIQHVESTTSITTTSISVEPKAEVESIERGRSDHDFVVEVYKKDKVMQGTTILPDNHVTGRPRVVEVNMLGEILWEYVLPKEFSDYTNPGFDVELVENNNILLVLPRKGVVEVNRDGEVVWSYMDPKVSHDADRLVNGNTLVVFGNEDKKNDFQVKEINIAGDVVWSWQAKDYFGQGEYSDMYLQGWTHTNAAERLGNGDTIISLRNFGIVVEVDPEGDVVNTFGEGLFEHQHDPVILDNGNLLVANHGSPQKALELDLETGEVLWSYTVDNPKSWPLRDANRLANGNTLITGVNVILEVTQDGEVVWKLLLKNVKFTREQAPALGFYKAERVTR
jgi:outer membrane protein assembly factor BamB